MYRLPSPEVIGKTLGDIRVMLGISRRGASRQIQKVTGRSETSINAQLWEWDSGVRVPTLPSLKHLLDVVDYDIALVPRSESPGRVKMLVAILAEDLERTGTRSGNMALSLLCEDFGIDRAALPAADRDFLLSLVGDAR